MNTASPKTIFSKGELTFVAGRPAMGKTSLLLTYLRQCILKEIPFMFFSLEHFTENQNEFLNKSDELEQTKSSFSNYHIDDTPGLGIADIENKIVDFVSSKDRTSAIEFVFIDYFQLLIDAKSDCAISRLKAIATKNNIALICSSQLSRELELREDKRPKLIDLEEIIKLDYSCIDNLIFLYRPSYYIDEDYDIPLEELNLTFDECGELIYYKKRKGILSLKAVIYTSFDNGNRTWHLG